MEVPLQPWILARLSNRPGTGRVGAGNSNRTEADHRAQRVKSHQQVITWPCHVESLLDTRLAAIA
jgi:hypothetical protein